MPTYSVSKIKKTFNEEIKSNKEVIKQLEDSIKAAKTNKSGLVGIYNVQLEQFVLAALVPLNEKELKLLSDASKGKADFVASYKNAVAASDAAQDKLEEMRRDHGSRDENSARVTSLDKDIKKKETALKSVRSAITKLAHVLEPVDEFNNKYGSKGNTQLRAAEKNRSDFNIGYFTAKKGFANFWKRLFDAHYRNGQNLVKAFARKGKTIDGVQKELAVVQSDEKTLSGEVQGLKKEMSGFASIITGMDKLEKQSVTHDFIVDSIRKDLTSRLADRVYFNDAVVAVPNNVPEGMVDVRAKMEALDKLSGNAEKRLKEIESTNFKLQSNVGKLDRARDSAEVVINLDDIKKATSGQRKMAEHTASETKKAGKKVTEYKPSTSRDFVPDVAATVLDTYMQIMMYDMLFDAFDKVDAHTWSDAIGIDDAVASAANIDVGHLMPDIDFSGLSDTFNSVGSTFDNFEMPDISDTLSNIGDSISDFGSSVADSFSSIDFGDFGD